jgi:hypothetical protein
MVSASKLPEPDVARLRRWCDERVPEHARDQVRVDCDLAAGHVTVVERRAPWRPDLGPEWTVRPVARLRYTKARGIWALYWRDRNGRFHPYDRIGPTAQVGELLAELDRDPTGIFWG